MKSANAFPSDAERLSGPDDLHLRHLQAEIARLDLLLRHAIGRWQLAGQDPDDAFRGLYVSDEEVQALLDRPVGSNWGHLAGEVDSRFKTALETAEGQSQALANQARAQGKTTRLDHLADSFGLDHFERSTLLLALAPFLDLRYQRIYGYLQDDVTKKEPAVNLALDLFAGPERYLHLRSFDARAPLFRWELLSMSSGGGTTLTRRLAIDLDVAAWLIGQYQPAGLSFPETDPLDELLAGELPGPSVTGVVLALAGPDGRARRAAARILAARAQRPLLAVSLAEGDPESRSLRVRLALRDARLTGALPCFTDWDTVLADEAPPAGLMAEILEHPEHVLLSGQATWQARGLARTRPVQWLHFPVPAYRRRLAIWRHLLQARFPEKGGQALDLESLALPHLAGQFALTSGQIRDALAAACDLAAQRGEPLNAADLLAAARAHSSLRLGALARKIEPRFGWEDIILPEDQLTILHELVDTVRRRPKVLDEWGVGLKLASSRGVTVLFAGPPGTGKTMAAEIMAAELGLDLYKIDLSGVVSKYIGETEKNLERIFEEAASSNAILFFDEADALFGKRSEVRDAHDRYANLEISYLLQRMEAYDGVTVLATNLRANLDEAFTRRLQFAVDFPFPEEPDRLRIWQTLFPPGVPRADLDFPLLAQRFKIAGGNIRNVIVNAAYLAAADGGVVTMRHMLHGTRRELQKMGRLLNEDELTSHE